MTDSIDRQKVLATLDFADKALDEERTVENYKELLTECIKALTSAENKGDLISRQAVIDAIQKLNIPEDMCVFEIISHIELAIATLPSVQPEPISEEYAKAVRSWLVDYQVKCAELHGRYTPYEVLGWIVNDWRKDNEIW